MGHPDGAHTHGSGGSGLGELLVILLAVAVLGPAVAAAAAVLLHILLIVAAVLAAIGGAGLVAYIALRLRHSATEPARRVYQAHPVEQRRTRALPESRPAIEAPPAPGQRVEVHHHWHGVSPEDVAAIIERGRQDG